MGFYIWHMFGITGDLSETESQLTGNPWTVRLENPTKPLSLSPSRDDSSLMKDRRQNSRPRTMVHTVPSFCGRWTAWCCPMTANTRYTHSGHGQSLIQAMFGEICVVKFINSNRIILRIERVEILNRYFGLKFNNLCIEFNGCAKFFKCQKLRISSNYV